jgi:hypothetical protein
MTADEIRLATSPPPDRLGNTVLALLKNPEQWRRLRDEPALVRSTVE